jgi:hypothetical protein
MPYMGAELYFHRKTIERDGSIVEMKIWRVPPSHDKPHGLKYSLVFIRDGKRIVGYDNAEGRGDHRHVRRREYGYSFMDIDRLIDDFLRDVDLARRGEL